jgi:hypothetical protein
MKQAKCNNNGGGLFGVSQVTARKSTKRRSLKRKGKDFLSYVEQGVHGYYFRFLPNTTLDAAMSVVNKQLKYGDKHVFTMNAEKIVKLIRFGQPITFRI